MVYDDDYIHTRYNIYEGIENADMCGMNSKRCIFLSGKNVEHVWGVAKGFGSYNNRG